MMLSKNQDYDSQLNIEFAMDQIPLQGLPDEAEEILSQALNKISIKATEDGFLRNYEGLADLIGLPFETINDIHNSPNPTRRLLELWKQRKGTTIGKLLDFLEELHRYDVIDDLKPILIRKSAHLLSFVCGPEDPDPDQDENGILNDPKRFGLTMYSRAKWGAKKSFATDSVLATPVKIVFIHHSAYFVNDSCATARSIQSFKTIHYGVCDVSYNFMVSPDGIILDGRGWQTKGAHVRNFNDYSISIGFLGNFEETQPEQVMLDAALRLIEYGVDIGKISPEYGLYAHGDASETDSPGKYILEKMKDWPHYHALGDILAINLHELGVKV